MFTERILCVKPYAMLWEYKQIGKYIPAPDEALSLVVRGTVRWANKYNVSTT